uniref:AMP_N domain-containing protein n=1 Tax=Bursaphelenchus xylophilus TaxID=6326 RepID=A0A1I7SDU1_BURXY
MSGGLYGKTALVVNGTDTIGKAISRRLGLAGAKIFLTGSSQQTLEQTVSDLGDKGVIACGAVFDPSIESHRKQLVEEIQNKYKGLDCVVLNPGRNEVTGDIINSSKLQFDQVFSQYLTIPFLLASSAYPLLQKSKNGSVIFLSSMAGYTSFIDLGLYSTVQTAVLGLTKALAVDMAKENVRVNSVVLGMFKDDETGSVWNTDDETAKNSLENLIPLGRLAQPKDCAGLIEFLVSDRARYISGMNGLKRLNYQDLLPIQGSEYIVRRLRLLERLKLHHPHPVVYLNGFKKTYCAPDVPSPFRQCSSFRYLAGALQPNSKLVITDKASTLFIHFKSDKERLWDGDSPDVDTLKKMSGLDDVLPLTELPRFLITNLQPSNSFAFDDRGLDEDESVVKLRSGFRGKRLVLLNEIDHLRWRKSPAEIEHLRTAARIGSEAHNAMLETQKNVNQESHIVGFLEYEMRRRGANCQAYSPVVAAGKRANTIHYIDSNKTIHNDDCVLVDAGADYHGYVSDITRCFPVSGTFTPAQRELYEALSEVHEECLEYAQNVRPLKLSGLYLHMLGAMATILKSMFFFKKGISDEEIIEACYKLCEHHVSHYLGMDVHDTPTVSRSIEMPPGVVFTIEPGIYVDRKMTETLINPQFADIGFRIEDDVLLTDTGIEILSKRAVRNGDDIEKLMKWSY